MENRRRIESWEITYSCDACELANIEYLGCFTFENNKPLYHYACPNCKTSFKFKDKYPFNEPDEVCKLK